MTINGIDIAKKTIGEFEFHEFKLLREFHIFVTNCNDRPAINVELCIDTEKRPLPARLYVRFFNISQLNIQEFGGNGRIDGFDIVDLSNRQLENINWEVCDFENGVINFYAEDAQIISASILRCRR